MKVQIHPVTEVYSLLNQQDNVLNPMNNSAIIIKREDRQAAESINELFLLYFGPD